MGAVRTLLTAEQFDNFPFEEDKRYELDEGEMLEMTLPAYRHNRVLKNLVFALEVYLRRKPIGEVLISENLFAFSPGVRLAPDAAIILGDPMSERRRALDGAKVISIIPDIAVEVLSPSESTARIHRKLKQYFVGGVKEVWLIDTEDKSVEIWMGPSLPDRAFMREEAIGSPLLPGFQLMLAELFA